ARPAGPAPTITVSYSAAAGSVVRSRSSATRRSCGRTAGSPFPTRTAGRALSAGRRARQCPAAAGAAPRRHPEPGRVAAGGRPHRGGRGRGFLLCGGGRGGRPHAEGGVWGGEEPPPPGGGAPPPMAEDDRPERGGCGRAGLQPFRPSEPIGGQEGHLFPDL